MGAAQRRGRQSPDHRRAAGHGLPARRRRSPWRAVAALAGVLAVAVTAVVVGLHAWTPDPVLVQRCVATAGDQRYTLDPDQADHAALFAAMALERQLPPRAVTIAIATAMQESRLRNIDYGDRDSLGLFQQRPSQGWGTPEQVQDPVYATGAFYDALVQVDGWEQLEVTVAAQAVQRSGFPEAYAQHEPMARAFAAALTGGTQASLGCTLAPVAGPGGHADGTDTDSQAGEADSGAPGATGTDTGSLLRARLQRELPSVQVREPEAGLGGSAETPDPADSRGAGTAAGQDGYLMLDAGDLWAGSAAEEPWPLAHWAVASAWATDVSEVIVGDRSWQRGSLQWHRVDGGPVAPPGQVLVR